MTPQEIVSLTDHASKQSDRYLFLLVVFFVIIGGAIFGVWLLRYIKDLVSQNRQDGQKLADVVTENTKAFTVQSLALNELSQEIRGLRSQ